MNRKYGSPIFVEGGASLVLDYKENPDCIIAVGRDITERKKAEEKLQESEDTLKAILNATSDSMFLIDTVGNILALNETTAFRLGKSKDELVGACIYDHLPPDIARSRRAYVDEAIRSGKAVSFEDKRNGEWIENSIYPIFNEQGKVEKIAINARYITERKVAEDKLKNAYQELEATQKASLNIMEDLDRERRKLDASLKEREVLLREIHHRVKNNMQIMSSLMRLQARTITDRSYSEMFKDALNRITAMSLIHEKLYRSKNLTGIGLRDYIRSLAEDIFQTYGISDGLQLFSILAEDQLKGNIEINRDKGTEFRLRFKI